MQLRSFDNVGIAGIAAAVPQQVVDNLAPNEWFSASETEAVVKMTGIRHRRIAAASVCASDLCAAAADRLLREMEIDRSTIDTLIFVTTHPDYRQPATAITLQPRLGLGQQTACFDVNLGCSGYVYGLWLAYSCCAQEPGRRVLLLNGATPSKAFSRKDKATGLLFGDAGAATLIERSPLMGRSYFRLSSDGDRSGHLIITHGGYRNPTTTEALIERSFPDGSLRSDEQGVMNGPGIFDFTIQEVPKDIRSVLAATGKTVNDFDCFLFHQANRFITDHIAKKLAIPPAKVPYSLQRFGNTSSVSIPITMVAELKQELATRQLELLLCGFGVGLSWGTAILRTDRIHVCDLVELLPPAND